MPDQFLQLASTKLFDHFIRADANSSEITFVDYWNADLFENSCLNRNSLGVKNELLKLAGKTYIKIHPFGIEMLGNKTTCFKTCPTTIYSLSLWK